MILILIKINNSTSLDQLIIKSILHVSYTLSLERLNFHRSCVQFEKRIKTVV